MPPRPAQFQPDSERSPRSPSPALSRDAGTTLAEQLAERLAERISQRLLPPGARLPSVREAARRHALSPSTVVAAYDRLQALGLVEARRQRGFFVREPRSTLPKPALPAQQPRPIDATALIRGMFHQGLRPSPGMGALPPEWLDLPLLHGALRRTMARRRQRAAVRRPGRRLRAARGPCPPAGRHRRAGRPAQIVTTAGATHALDLVSRVLLEPGDSVLVDEPGWAVEFARLSRLGHAAAAGAARAGGAGPRRDGAAAARTGRGCT